MVERRSGSIINIASIVGLVPLRRQIAYAAAKAGVINTSKAAALELGPYGIRVNAIAPGSTLTPATRAYFYNPGNQKAADSIVSHIPLAVPERRRIWPTRLCSSRPPSLPTLPAP